MNEFAHLAVTDPKFDHMVEACKEVGMSVRQYEMLRRRLAEITQNAS